MVNPTPAPQPEDLSLGLGVNAFRPGRDLRRSDLPPYLQQPTVEQDEDESNPDSTERGQEEEQQSEAPNPIPSGSEVVRRLEAELARERAKY